MTSIACRVVCFAGLALALTVPSSAEKLTVEGPAVELPTYTVKEAAMLPEPESWRYARFGNFEVLSNASEGKTKSLLKDFQLFSAALDVVWPAVQPRSTSPVSLILCTQNRMFQRFFPANFADRSEVESSSSVFLHRGEHGAIVINFAPENTAVVGDDVASHTLADLGVATFSLEIDQTKLLQREYVHFLISRFEQKPPAWFAEGLAQLLSEMTYDEKHITFAKLEDPNEISAEQAMAQSRAKAAASDGDPVDPAMATAPAEDRSFQASLGKSGLLSFPALFAVQSDSPTARNTLGSKWAKQSYAFVHLCLYGEHHRYQKGLFQFLARTAKEPVTEALFKECFGESYNSMGIVLRGYIDVASHQHFEWKLKAGGKGFAELPSIALREATQAEIGRIKGDALLMADRADLARQEMLTAYLRGERDPNLLAAFGLEEVIRGDVERGGKLLNAAVAAKVDRPDAYVALARLRFVAAVAKNGENHPFSRVEAGEIITLVHAGFQRAPQSLALYEMLAQTWLRVDEKIRHDDALLLLQGAARYPDQAGLTYDTARLAASIGAFDAASALTEHGLIIAGDPETKAAFQELKTTLATRGGKRE